MADDVRLQVRKNNTENEWADVGNKVGNESIPVTLKETTPTDTTKLNASVTITEVTVGTVTTKTIQKTIGTDVYQKTVASDSSDNSITISVWSKL